MEIQDVIEEAVQSIQEYINEHCTEVKAEQLGLDRRAAYSGLYVCDDAIVCTSASTKRVLEYYGGFEYVDRENVTCIGDITIYSSGDSRVQECLDRYEEQNDR